MDMSKKLKENYNMKDFKVGDMVWISPKSIGAEPTPPERCEECVKILKITPKRFKVEWDMDGQRDEPVIIYVKYVYKNPDDVIY
jgi:hypothetical protein